MKTNPATWICNECNMPNFTQSVPKEEIELEMHSCINCGGFEFHLDTQHSSSTEIKKEKLAMELNVNDKKKTELLNLFLEDNHSKYLSKPLNIGFMDSFPEEPDGVIDEIEVTDICKGFNVKFKVRYGTVTFGAAIKHSCHAITTDIVKIPRTGALSGFGQHTCYDEAAVMERAIITMARKHGLMICNKVCSWAFAKAIVQPVESAHLKDFEREQKIKEK